MNLRIMDAYMSIWLYHSNLYETLDLPLNMDNHKKVLEKIRYNGKYWTQLVIFFSIGQQALNSLVLQNK